MAKRKKQKLFYFSYFEKLFESWEKSTSKALELWSNNPLLNNCMEKAIEKSLEFKDYSQEIIERSLNYRYFPTKNDFLKLMNSLENVETKLFDLEDKIHEVRNTEGSKKLKKQRTKSRRKKSEQRKS